MSAKYCAHCGAPLYSNAAFCSQCGQAVSALPSLTDALQDPDADVRFYSAWALGDIGDSAAVAPLRTHCRRFWYFYRQRLRLSDAIAAHASMVRLVARRDYQGAQKSSDAVIATLERLVASVE